MRKSYLILGLLAILTAGATTAYFMHKSLQQHVVFVKPTMQVASVEKPVFKYGLNLSEFKVLTHVVKQNEFFADILSQYNVTYATIDYLAHQSKAIFNLNKMKAGNSCTVLCGV